MVGRALKIGKKKNERILIGLLREYALLAATLFF